MAEDLTTSLRFLLVRLSREACNKFRTMILWIYVLIKPVFDLIRSMTVILPEISSVCDSV
jgi:hypothetical protein